MFLDRDGVLNESIVRDGKPYPPEKPADLRIIPGTQEALDRLKERGFLLIVVTNQPDVGRGTQTQVAVDEMHARLRRELPIDDVYVCTHDDAAQCDCRKPQPGMLLRAAKEYAIDLSQSYMVGDRWRDIDAGAKAGCKTLWIDRGYAERSSSASPDIRVSSLGEAANWIVKRQAASGSVRGIAWSLFIALFGIYLFMSPGGIGGSGYTGEEIDSGLRMMSIVTAVSKGRPIPPMLWSRHGPTPVMFDLPFLKLGKVFASPDFALSFEPVLVTAAIMALVFLWLRKICSPAAALFLTLAGAFGTMLWPYAYIGLETKQSLFVLLAGYWGLACGRIRGWPRLVGFALVCGFALTLKSTGVILWPAIAYLFYVQYRGDWRQRWGQLLTLSALVIAICWLNVFLRNFYWEPLGGSGPALKAWVVQSSFQIFTNIIGLFGSPSKGLFVFAPILVGILWAVPRTFRVNRDLAIFASLILVCTIGFLSILNYTTDEVWGTRYLHVTIAPLLLCVGAAWPNLTWRAYLPLGVLAVVGVAISFLGAFFYYGTRGAASDETRQNTMEWLTSDPLWNEVTFSARLFRVWWRGGSDPVPWTATHLWVWTPPKDVPAWRTIDLKKIADSQSFVFYYWRRPIDYSQERLIRFYLVSLAIGLGMLVRTIWLSFRIPKPDQPSRRRIPKWKIATGLAGIAFVAMAGVWVATPRKFEPKLTLDRTEVAAGAGNYTLNVREMPNETIVVRYSLDGAAPAEMTALLNSRGGVYFDVGAETPKGVYRMLAFRRKGDLFWFDTNASITVK